VPPIFPSYALPVLHHCLADSGARAALAGSAVQQHQLAQVRQLEHTVEFDDQPFGIDQFDRRQSPSFMWA
jgi:hypothetical protein